MSVGPVERLFHIKKAIREIGYGVGGLSPEVLTENAFILGGFRYQLLIISEAARHLPKEWKQEFDLDWRGLEDIGNRLRHAYHDVNISILWSIYENDLDPLEAAIDAMIAAHSDASKG